MNETRKVFLKPGRDRALRQRHPWIFSGAVASFPVFEDGEVLPVFSSCGSFLAKAYFHSRNSISGRVLTFLDDPVDRVIEEQICRAVKLREKMFDRSLTNAFRLINSEGDGLPGLIVDIYDDVAVIQVNTHGIERLKPVIVEILARTLRPRGIFEKSQSGARRKEGLGDRVGPLFGECPATIPIRENGARFLVALEEGQKTGFFLDQREMRQMVGRISQNRRVLNCFSYTGGFSVFALKGGAHSVTSVDVSQEACRWAKENILLNHLPEELHQVIQEDVFSWLKPERGSFDLILLDPPAFAKKRQDVEHACRGYKEINRRALEMILPDSYLLTSSCSHFIDETLFQQLVFQAALEAGRDVCVCSCHIQAHDHPVSLFHPEGAYLKSLLLHVF